MPALMAAMTPEDARSGDDGDRHARGGAHDHHPLDAEVQDARAFHHQFADGGDQERRGRGDDGQEDRGGEHHASALRGAGRSR
jgi:hypothetical protein